MYDWLLKQNKTSINAVNSNAYTGFVLSVPIIMLKINE